jgi:hypothetical protein
MIRLLDVEIENLKNQIHEHEEENSDLQTEFETKEMTLT